MQNIRQILPLYFIAGTQDCRHLSGDPAQHLLSILEQALQSGVTCFQFRDKGKFSLVGQPEKQKELAIKCRDLCNKYNVPFIIDDNVDLALEINADGVHVGQSDMSALEIRKKTDKPIIVGLSVNKMTEALASNDLEAIDYFGIGPIFPTQSKEDPKPVVGIDFIKTLREAGITKPLVAIGGVKADSVEQLRKNGADGVAVITAITYSENIPQTVKALLRGHHEE
ncbi:thiamine phosphate synthase [Otariodibacter oris]|uniref:Thiamine-phosphate synthase n=1 Tax=Otariodibacter oris TaxID=1032623 RepID=A0A420XJB9_9PAST|nr:thiamine phosphate synthase [Otariodibacter oris]QGM80650.1 thiamine-phosphate diphosphorylase [Otariodibacter oris]RKR77190.1 thiamine-phosphate diphosphorylase [Otariodibacter oris]